MASRICAKMETLQEAEGYCLVSSALKKGSPRDLSARILDEFGLAPLNFPLFGEQPHVKGTMQAAFSYKALKDALRARRAWSCPKVVFVGIGDTATRAFPALTGLAIDSELRCAHYCMWHRLDASSAAWIKVAQVLTSVMGPSDFRERVVRVAQQYAREHASDSFKFFFRTHTRSAAHASNHRAAICNPSASTQAAQSSNMKRLRRSGSFEEKRSVAVKESLALSASSSKRMLASHNAQREACGRKKFVAIGNTEAAEASRCPWCDDDTLCAEGVYKNGRLLCATCGLSCYIEEDRSGLERRKPQWRALAQLRKRRDGASLRKQPYLERALSRLENLSLELEA